jgi:GNAT superfamily N-acetyltransferase
MPSKQYSGVPFRCKRRHDQTGDSVELASVHLELESRVEPTWDNPEPEDYIVDLRGDVMVRGNLDEDDVRVGSVSAFLVHLEQAYEDGMPWFDVLDAHSADMAVYLNLIDDSESRYTEWVETRFEPFGSDLLILDRIRIEPEHRGHGYGLYAAELIINGFGPSSGLVACVPAPYELLRDAPIRTNDNGAQIGHERPIPGWEAAEAKLRKHWSLLGFQQVASSDVFALSLTARRPSIETVIQKYVAGRRRQIATQ